MIADGTRRIRPNLVFVRAGKASLHNQWIAQDAGRNWDCVVSWWGKEPEATSAELVVTGGEFKLDAFQLFYRLHSGLVQQYERVLLADDDLAFPPTGISKLFSFCAQHEIELAQPAIRWRSHVNHPVTGYCPLTQARRVTFVEMMAPVFSRRVLIEAVETFHVTRSGTGIDWLWSHMFQEDPGLFIIDRHPVDHTKPVDPTGGALYARYRSLGISSWNDYVEMRSRYPIAGGIRPANGDHIYWQALPRRIANQAVIGWWLLLRLWHRITLAVPAAHRLLQRVRRVLDHPRREV